MRCCPVVRKRVGQVLKVIKMTIETHELHTVCIWKASGLPVVCKAAAGQCAAAPLCPSVVTTDWMDWTGWTGLDGLHSLGLDEPPRVGVG